MNNPLSYNPDEYAIGDHDERPWGSWEVIDVQSKNGEHVIEKKITVYPTGLLSLHSHRHRCETWTVLSGTIRVVLNEETFDLKKGESIKIPVGAKHRIANPYQEEAVVHEIQNGQCRESDIVRYEDKYGRA